MESHETGAAVASAVSLPSIGGQSPAMTAFKGLGLVVAVGLDVVLALRLAGAVRVATDVAWLAGGGLLGYLAADLMSGTVHWFCDTFFSEETPLIGRRLIQPFRVHHHDPLEITRCGVLEQDASSYLVLIPAVWAVQRSPAHGAFALLAQAALLGLALGALGTNLFHKWAHSSRVPAGVRWLQRHRLILSPDAHDVHHRSYTGGYCVTSGWMNRCLDPVDFFPRLERAVRRLLPAKGRHRGG